MPIGSSKLGVLGAGLVPGGTETFNAPGTFSIPPGVKKVSITGKGGTGNPGVAGNPGNPGNPGSGGAGGGAGLGYIYGPGLPDSGCGPGTQPISRGPGGDAFITFNSISVPSKPAGRDGDAQNNAGVNFVFGGRRFGYNTNTPAPPAQFFPANPPGIGQSGVSGTAGSAGNAGCAGNPGQASSGLGNTFPGGAGGNAGVAGAAGTSGGGGTGGASGNDAGFVPIPQRATPTQGTGGAGAQGGGSGGNGNNTNVPPGGNSTTSYNGQGGGGAGSINSGQNGQTGGMVTTAPGPPASPNTPLIVPVPGSPTQFIWPTIGLAIGGTGNALLCVPTGLARNVSPPNVTGYGPLTNPNQSTRSGGNGGGVTINPQGASWLPLGSSGKPSLIGTIQSTSYCQGVTPSRPIPAPQGGGFVSQVTGACNVNPACARPDALRAGGGGGSGERNAPICVQSMRGGGGGAGGGRGLAGNAGGTSPTPTGTAGTPQTFNCVPVTPGGTAPITVASPGGQIVISWNPQ